MTRTATACWRAPVERLEERETPAILFGVTANNFLVAFDSAEPDVILRAQPIVGFFSPGEVITDIDVRPGTGALFGRSNFDRLFLINPLNPLALPVGGPVTTTGAPIGFDFDPRNDRIRIFTNAGENVILDSINGALVRFATPLSYAAGDRFAGLPPRVTGLAFVNSVPNATFTGLFAIDHRRNTLVRPGAQSLNSGILSTIGNLGLDVTSRIGFDIAPLTHTLFASLQQAGQSISGLHVINPATGRATLIGSIGGGLLLNDIAIDLQGTSGFTSATDPTPPSFFFSSGSGTGSFTFTSQPPIQPFPIPPLTPAPVLPPPPATTTQPIIF